MGHSLSPVRSRWAVATAAFLFTHVHGSSAAWPWTWGGIRHATTNHGRGARGPSRNLRSRWAVATDALLFTHVHRSSAAQPLVFPFLDRSVLGLSRTKLSRDSRAFAYNPLHRGTGRLQSPPRDCKSLQRGHAQPLGNHSDILHGMTKHNCPMPTLYNERASRGREIRRHHRGPGGGSSLVLVGN